MADYLPVPARSPLPSRMERRTSRALERLDAEAAIATRADALRIERITEAASHAQSAVSYLSALELVHVQGSQNPLTEMRVLQITEAATLGLRGAVLRAGR